MEGLFNSNLANNNLVSTHNKLSTMSLNTEFIMSIQGIYRLTCVQGCRDQTCMRAHGNILGSVVKNPRWCVDGWFNTCRRPRCAFNHFMSELAYVKYRSNDSMWKEKNSDLVKKYQ